MKNGNNYQGKSGAPDGECCVEKRSTTNGVGEAQNDKDKRQSSSCGAPKQEGVGVWNEIEEGKKRVG